MRPQRVEKPSAQQTPPDARKVRLRQRLRRKTHLLRHSKDYYYSPTLYCSDAFFNEVKQHNLPDVSNACNHAVRPYFPPANTKRPSA